ncbi:MAG: hypothetical protein EOO93_26645, partial [Pedobacter sp.]
MDKKLRPIIKWTGGKYDEFALFAAHIPKFDRYIEPFFGGGGVFFALQPSVKSFVNDKSTDLINFYKQIGNKDFHNHVVENPIIITVEFYKFSPHEQDLFGAAISEGKMTVIREFAHNDTSPNYSVVAKVNTNFTAFRDELNGTKKRSVFNALRKQYTDLPACATVDEMSSALKEWEAKNLSQCSFEKVKAFFGATNVAAGKLATKTALHFIPAVREVSQDTEGSRSPAVALLA